MTRSSSSLQIFAPPSIACKLATPVGIGADVAVLVLVGVGVTVGVNVTLGVSDGVEVRFGVGHIASVGVGVDLGYRYWVEDSEIVIFEPFIGITRIAMDTGAITHREEFDRFLLYISPDHRWIIGRDGPFEPDIAASIVIYRFDPLEALAALEAHTEIVRYASWSPNSRYFASIGGPNTVIIWEILEDSAG